MQFCVNPTVFTRLMICGGVQVGLGILVLEYKRGERKDEAKKKKEEDFRRQLDEGVHRDREVGTSTLMPSVFVNTGRPPHRVQPLSLDLCPNPLRHVCCTVRYGLR